MPLVIRSAVDAVALRKSNPLSGWPSRNQSNRVEPIAMPGFEFDVSVAPGDRIFTMGSCFARNVEEELLRAGFRVPMRELFRTAEYADVPATVTNNFSTPSLYNELAWAVGEQEFDEDLSILEYGSGRFIDLHAGINMRPEPRETIVARRRALTKAYREFRQCGLAVITLGLVEVWFDKLAGHYVNAIPPPAILKRYEGRFELHVLDFSETLDFCERMIDIFERHGREDLVVLLSVSPVPLTASHRGGDVMINNCYSKSVLRAVTEHVVMRHDRVRYFPSYESVTLSNRALAWEDDLIHVQPGIVRRNVERLVQQLVRGGEPSDALAALNRDMEAATEESAPLLAMEAARLDPAEAAVFFERHEGWVARSAAFAAEQLAWLAARGRHEDVIEFAKRSDVDLVDYKSRYRIAAALVHVGEAKEAAELLESIEWVERERFDFWRMLIVSLARSGDFVGLERAFTQLGSLKKKWLGEAHVAAGTEFLRSRNLSRAREHAEQAHFFSPDAPSTNILLAELAMFDGELSRAGEMASDMGVLAGKFEVRRQRILAAAGRVAAG